MARNDRKKPLDNRSPERPIEPPHETTRRWDEVDETSWESFPASDPPPFGGGARRRSQRRAEDDAKRREGQDADAASTREGT